MKNDSKLHQPVQILEKWKATRLAGWIRKYEAFSTVSAPISLAVLVLIMGLSTQYLHGVILNVVGAIVFTSSILVIILVASAKEANRQ